MKKRRIWTILGILTAGLAVVSLYMQSTRGVPVTASPVASGKIRTYVDDRAKTTLPRIYRLTMPVYGRILPIGVKVGEEVKQGQLVAQMDTADLETEVALAESKLEEIRARIDLNMNNDLEKTVLEESASMIKAAQDTFQASEETVRAGEEDVKFAEAWLTANRALSRDVAKLTIQEAEKDYVKAKVDLATDKLISSSVRALKEAVDLGPKYVDKWINRKGLEREILIEQKRGAEAALDKAERDLKRARISSPVDGVILARHVENERVLPADSPLLDIGKLSELEVTAEILSEDAVLINPGDPVEIHGAAFGADTVQGKVLRINPQGITKLSSLGVEQQRVEVKIAFLPREIEKLKASGRNLGLAFRVRVRIYTDEKDKTLIVPRTALFRSENGDWQVFVIEDGLARQTTVKVGLINDTQAEIIEGLSLNDSVILAPPKTLASGDRVEV